MVLWVRDHPDALLGVFWVLVAAAAVHFSFFATSRRPSLPTRGVLPILHRVSYTGSFTYRADRWHVEESILVEREDLPPSLRRRGRSPAIAIAHALSKDGWKVRPEKLGTTTSYRLFHHSTSGPLGVPTQRPLTKDISIAPRVFDLFGRTFVPVEGSVLILHAEQHRIRSTTPSSDSAAETDHHERRVVALDVTAHDGLGAGVAVRIASDWATSDWMPQEVVDATTAGWVRWVLGLLGFGVVTGRRWLMRVLKWVWTGEWSAPASGSGE